MRDFAESRSYVFLGGMQFRIGQIEERIRLGVDPGSLVEKERETLEHDLMIYRVLFPPDGRRIYEPSGEKEHVVNLVSIARENGEQLLFDHNWVVATQGSEGAPRRNRFGETIAAFRSGLLSDIPPFSLSSRKAHERMMRNLSNKNLRQMLEESVVPLDSHPAFSEAYVLTAGKNKDAVREAIPPQFLELMQPWVGTVSEGMAYRSRPLRRHRAHRKPGRPHRTELRHRLPADWMIGERCQRRMPSPPTKDVYTSTARTPLYN